MRHSRQFTFAFLGIFFPLSTAISSSLPEEWKNVQEATVSSAGLLKFSIPVTTLDAARPNLEDLRIFDSDGNEVPYVIEQPRHRDRAGAKAFHALIERQTTIVYVETGISQPIDALEFHTYTPAFIKSVQLEGSEDGIHWKVLVKGQPIYRQADGTSQLRISFPAGARKFLRAIIDDTRAEPIAIYGINLRIVPKPIPVEEIVVKILERSESPGQTRIVLDLGAANLTLAAIHLETPELVFQRKVTAAVQQISKNEIRESIIASDTIERVNAQEELAPAHFLFPSDIRNTSRKVLLLIDNKASPPLTITAIKAMRRPVYLVFVAKKAGTYSIMTGNNSYEAPSYDLAALGSSLVNAILIAPEIKPLAKNPAFRRPEALPEISRLGTPLDVSDWRYRKKMRIGVEGVQESELDLEILSHAQASLYDLRLMDQSSQIPYVIERTSIAKWITAQGSQANDPQKPSFTRLKFKLPYRSLPLIGLQCTPKTAVFQRSVTVYELVPDERGNEIQRNLGEAVWTQTLEQKQTMLTVSLTPPSTNFVFLEINNRDNPSIQLEDFQFCYNVTRLLFKAMSGMEPFLYYGNPVAASPEYDIRLVAPQLLAAERSIAKLDAEKVLKEPSVREKYMGTRTSNIIFWIALVLVVLVLFLIISRLLPKANPG